jgi:hypothetical protein
MSRWVGLTRAQLRAITSQPAPTHDPRVPVQHFKMDGTRRAEGAGRQTISGSWSNGRPGVPRRKRVTTAEGLAHEDPRRRHAEGIQPALNKARTNVFLEWT